LRPFHRTKGSGDHHELVTQVASIGPAERASADDLAARGLGLGSLKAFDVELADVNPLLGRGVDIGVSLRRWNPSMAFCTAERMYKSPPTTAIRPRS